MIPVKGAPEKKIVYKDFEKMMAEGKIIPGNCG
jgi:hypothetical protein